jgi:hypothetical protein
MLGSASCKRWILGVAVNAVIFAVHISGTAVADPILNVYVEHIEVTPYDSLVEFTVTMNSTEDTVWGFQMWLQMADPFVMRFDTLQPIDVSGSLISNWDMVDWNILDTYGGVLTIVALPDWPTNKGTKIPPSEDPQLLLTLRAEIADQEPDTLCDYAGDVWLNEYWTKFSTCTSPTDCDLIGYDSWVEYDTTFQNCVEWIGDSCVAWSDTIVDTSYFSEPNFDLLNFQSGSYSFTCFDCGDCDGSGGVDIDDAVLLILYIFSGGPAPDPLQSGDVDLSGDVDIDDVVYLIAFIFTGGPSPCAQ